MEEVDAHGPRLQMALFERGRPPAAEPAAAFAARARELVAQSP
jgi:hypothetical protein